MGDVQGSSVLVVNYCRRILSGAIIWGNCPRWELSRGALVLGGNCPGAIFLIGNCPGGSCLGGICPVP